jgi:putative tricarboxylic transport membrane protein
LLASHARAQCGLGRIVRTQRSADLASGCFLALLGLVVIAAASQITGGMEERLPPRTLPYTTGVAVLVTGAALAVRSWRSREPDAPIKWPDREGSIRVLVSLGALAVYVAVLNPLGMPIATVLFIAFLVWYLGRTGLVYAALVGLASGATVFFLFIRLLELSLPAGPLAP